MREMLIISTVNSGHADWYRQAQRATGDSDVPELVYCLFICLFVYLDFADKLAVLIIVCVRKLINLDLVFLDFLHNLEERGTFRRR